MLKSNCIVIIFVFLVACSPIDNKNEAEARHKKTIEAYVDTIWNQKKLDSLDVFFPSKFIRKVNNIDLAVDKAELTANLKILFKSFPDLQMNIDYMTAAKNKVYMNWTLNGTNKGDFGAYPGKGLKVKISGISRIDFDEDGKIIYENIFYNELSLMQQLGYNLMMPNNE